MKVTFTITPTLDRDRRGRAIFSEAGKYLGKISPNGKGGFFTEVHGMRQARGSRKSCIAAVTSHFDEQL